ncbi:flexible cuticle protein 12-like [Chelonus insularis]|uniref:flexible cuticle protein 12-like n=1 Tax=Chelonus insularis TaxID=460826 RepID=UPI00158BEE89|nr:flexible cuticle protein 12-like [Chelonus insularis]
MKMFIVLAALVAVSLAAPAQQQQQQVQVVQEKVHDNIGVGDYSYSYQLNDGQSVEQSAQLRSAAGVESQAYYVVSGSFSYVDPVTNQSYKVTYTADENGFHPVGDHLPA